MQPIGADTARKILELCINYLLPHHFEESQQIDAIYEIRAVFANLDSSSTIAWDYETMGNPMDYSKHMLNVDMALGALHPKRVESLVESLMHLVNSENFVLKFRAIRLLDDVTAKPISHMQTRTLDPNGKNRLKDLLKITTLPDSIDVDSAIGFLLNEPDPSGQLFFLLLFLEHQDQDLVDWALKALEKSSLLDAPGNQEKFVSRINELVPKLREDKVDGEWMPFYEKLKIINRKKGGKELPGLPSNLTSLIKQPQQNPPKTLLQEPPGRRISCPKPDFVRGDGVRQLSVYLGGRHRKN